MFNHVGVNERVDRGERKSPFAIDASYSVPNGARCAMRSSTLEVTGYAFFDALQYGFAVQLGAKFTASYALV